MRHSFLPTWSFAAVSKACHNDFLIQLNTLVGAALRSMQYVSRQLRGGSKNALRLHKAVAEAIRKHNGSEARKATQRLVKQAPGSEPRRT